MAKKKEMEVAAVDDSISTSAGVQSDMGDDLYVSPEVAEAQAGVEVVYDRTLVSPEPDLTEYYELLEAQNAEQNQEA